MATYKIEAGQIGAYSKTLAANAVDTIIIAGPLEGVEITNKSGSAEINFTTDGSAPTVDGASTHELPAALSSRVVDVNAGHGETVEIKLISGGTPEYSVARSQL
jgi:hypothetical protein